MAWFKRRAKGIAEDSGGNRTFPPGIDPHVRDPFQHLSRKVERDAIRFVSPDERKESTRSRADVEDPSLASGVTEQEPFAQLSEQIALGRALVAEPLSAGAIRVEVTKPFSRRFVGLGCRSRRGATRRSHVRARGARAR